MTHSQFFPIDTTVLLDGENVSLFFRDDSSNTIGIKITPQIMEKLLHLFARSIYSSTSKDMKELSDLFAIQSLIASRENNHPMIRYTNRLQLEIATAIDDETAQQIVQAFSKPPTEAADLH